MPDQSRRTDERRVPDRRRLPRASVADTLLVVGAVLAPTLARGVIVRRPAVVRVLARVDADSRAVRTLQRLRRRYGPGPLRLRTGRRMVVLLEPEHVTRVLAQSPEPFSPATREKVAALGHFQPHGVLISTGAARAERRTYVEAALDSAHRLHPQAPAIAPRVAHEVGALTGLTELTYDDLARVWWRIVRGALLGDGARDDEALTDDLRRLRADANWAFLRPRRDDLRERFLARLGEHLDRAEPGSVAAHMAALPASPATDPVQQVPQWLFAFDAGALATMRALAVLATHPAHLARARAEAADGDPAGPRELPFLRACVLDSVRLWPTTPAILRETTARTSWPGGPVPEGTLVVLFAPYFHRDDERFAAAHRFAPELWSGGRGEADWPLVPFSAGPAQCPGRNLVLHVASTVLAHLVAAPWSLPDGGPRLAPDRPLPGTLDPFSLTLRRGGPPAGRSRA